MIHHRHTSTLFVIATACAAAAVLAAENTIAWQGIFTGLLSVVSVWAVVGQSHHLARAGGFVATVSLICAVEARSSGTTLAESATVPRLWIFAVSVVLAITAMRLLGLWARSRSEGDDADESVRFSLMDFFGWTTVVALACFLLQQIASQEFLKPEAYAVLLPLVGIACCGSRLVGIQSRRQFVLRGAMFLMVTLACVVLAREYFADSTFVPIMLIQSLIVLAWGWVQWVDDQQNTEHSRRDSIAGWVGQQQR